ncbi:MAG: hypothetical protein AAF533_09210 [Acidobacteriota bacterium]
MTITVRESWVEDGAFVGSSRRLLIDDGSGLDVQVVGEADAEGRTWLRIEAGPVLGWVPKAHTRPHDAPPQQVAPPRLALWAPDGVQVWGGDTNEFELLGELDGADRRGYLLRSGEWLLLSESTTERQYWVRDQAVETDLERLSDQEKAK